MILDPVHSVMMIKMQDQACMPGNVYQATDKMTRHHMNEMTRRHARGEPNHRLLDAMMANAIEETDNA